MRRRKRVLLFVCVLIVAAIAFVVSASRRGSMPSLSISFIGYTNSPFISSTNGIMALMRVTNTGPVTLRLLGVTTFTHASSATSTSATEIVDGGLFFPVLGAGASATVEAEVPRDFELLSGKATFVRWRLRDRASQWAWSTGNARIQHQLSRITFLHRDVFQSQFDPITNQIRTNMWPHLLK